MATIYPPTGQTAESSILPWVATGGLGTPTWSVSQAEGAYDAYWTGGSSIDGSATWTLPAAASDKLRGRTVTVTVTIKAAAGANGGGRVRIADNIGSALGAEIQGATGVSTAVLAVDAAATSLVINLQARANGSGTSGNIYFSWPSISITYSGALITIRSPRGELSTTLTAAMQTAAGNSSNDYTTKGIGRPFGFITLTSRSGSVVKTYTTEDSPNRIFKVLASEGMYGGSLYQVAGPDGRLIDVAAELVFNNNDKEFSTLDLRGYKVLIGWGFVTFAGEYAFGEPYWVLSQRNISFEGSNYTIFRCMSAWQRLEYQKAIGLAAGTYTLYTITDVIRYALMDLFTDNADTCRLFAGGAFTPVAPGYDTAAQNNTVNDVRPLAATPAVGDIFYIGDDEVFDRVSMHVTTAGVKGAATITLVWEYYNGAAWATLTADVGEATLDHTVDFTTLGLKVVTFTLPTDWATVAVDGATKYFIRARVSAAAGGAWTTQPWIGRIGIGRDWAIEVLTTDSIEDSVTTTLTTTYDESIRAVVARAIARTKCKLYMTPTYFVATVFTDAPGSTDYDYELDGEHPFKQSEYEQGLVIPNQIVCTASGDPTAPTWIGTANHASTQTAIGVITEFVRDAAVTSNALALAVAERVRDRYVQTAFQGEFTAAIDVDRNPWAWVGVRDTRNTAGAGNTYTGRVGHIVREFNPYEQVYRMTVSLGLRKLGALDLITANRTLDGPAVTSGAYDWMRPRTTAEEMDELITASQTRQRAGIPMTVPQTIPDYSGFRAVSLAPPVFPAKPQPQVLATVSAVNFLQQQLINIRRVAAQLQNVFDDMRGPKLTQYSRDVLARQASLYEQESKRLDELIKGGK